MLIKIYIINSRLTSLGCNINFTKDNASKKERINSSQLICFDA